jgi:hypothetical protein
VTFPSVLASITVVGLLLRLLPFLYQRRQGNDHWFWMLYVETLRERKSFPPKLPFLLDEQQWYPPLFPLLLACLPIGWLKPLARLIAPVIDTLQLVAVMIVAQHISESTVAAALAGALYALAPLCIDYNYQLNPRGLGSLLLSTQLIIYYAYTQTPDLLLLGGVLVLGAAILLLHKMTSQMMVFFLLFRGIWSSDITALLLIPGTVAAAWLFSGGFYWKVLKAHGDIVVFWYRHWNTLNAHQYYDSDLYRKESGARRLLHTGGFEGATRHVRNILAANPAILCVVVLLAVHNRTLTSLEAFNVQWLAAASVWALATSLIPQLRCFGAGVYYTYNAVFPIALLSGILVLDTSAIGPLAYAASILTCSAVILRILRRKRQVGSSSAPMDNIEPVLATLRELPEGPTYCVPLGLSDRVAYTTRREVLWGAHGYGFNNLEPFYPVMQVTLEELLETHAVRFVLINRDYAIEKEIVRDLNSWRPIIEVGHFALYETPYFSSC